MASVFDQLADAFTRRKLALAEKDKQKTKLAGSDYFMPKSSKEELAKRQVTLEESGLPGVLKEAGREMYENPIVNTAISLAPGASDIQSGYEAWKSAQEGKYLEAGLNLAGVSPVIPSLSALAGIFAGKGAKTADLPKLFEAQKMASEGLPREEIWNKTGWFQGPDKQWKFEIPDYESAFKGNVVKELKSKPGVEQSKIFQHEPLHEAYPESAKIWTGRMAGEGGGGYSKGVMGESDMIGLGMPAKKFPDLEEMRGSNLHELQHAIQNKEGFARGGDPRDIARNPMDYANPEWVDYAKSLPAYEKQTTPEAKQEFINSFVKMKLGHPEDAYYRLAGEEEARLVQKRMNMTPEELRATPPWTMYETPEAGQIVRFNQTPGVQSSIENIATNYRMAHTAPNREFGAQLHDLSAIYPEDIYSSNAARYYGGGGDAAWRKMDNESVRIAQSFRGKPDADVTIYRAVPKDEKITKINPGDWVTINKDYARTHGESNLPEGYKIISQKVKAKDIWTNADSVHEYGYDPQL